MKRQTAQAWTVILAAFFVASAVSPSWSWVRLGFRGPWVGSYPYYYQPYAYYPSYAVSDPESEQVRPPSDDNDRNDVRSLLKEIDRVRGQVDFALDDGDITQKRHDAEIGRLADIEKEAHAEMRAGGGTITRDQEMALLQDLRSGGRPVRSYLEETAPPNPGRDPKAVLERIDHMRAILDKKVGDGSITKAQSDSMKHYLDRTEKKVRSDAKDAGFTTDKEKAVLTQLDRAESAINQNFVAP